MFNYSFHRERGENIYMKYAKLLTIIAVICMFAFVTVWAQDTKTAAPAKVEKKAEMKKDIKAEKPMFEGKVITVDAMKNTFTVEKELKGKDGKVVMKDGKPVMRSLTFEAGKSIKIADIAKGAKIHVMYNKDGEKMMAESVKPMTMEKKEGMKKEGMKMEKKEGMEMEKKEEAPK
jgi:hypothetical protein